MQSRCGAASDAVIQNSELRFGFLVEVEVFPAASAVSTQSFFSESPCNGFFE